MPFLVLDEVRLHYELSGPSGAPVVLFSNSLGTNLSMWDAQRAALEKEFRILRYDKRGHGTSSAPPLPTPSRNWGKMCLACSTACAWTASIFAAFRLAA
ncbi:MAG TPA: hypothetical protein VLC12_01980 [Terriglobales bacterium]|nr:hypothetical protein [Terriglobales bacterium]